MNTSCHYMVKKLDQQSCAKFDTFNIKGGGADGRTTKVDIKWQHVQYRGAIKEFRDFGATLFIK